MPRFETLKQGITAPFFRFINDYTTVRCGNHRTTGSVMKRMLKD